MFHRSSHKERDRRQASPGSEETHANSLSTAIRRRSSGLKFLSSNSPPKPDANHQTHKEWEAQYLKSLRTDRPTRPSGSRPPPSKVPVTEPYVRAASALSMGPSLINQEIPKPTLQERAASALSHRRAQSDMQKLGYRDSMSGRALAQPPNIRQSIGDIDVHNSSPEPDPKTVTMPYHEDGLRWVEKQEAKALRDAMQEMELREEAKVHANAQDEASQLVWQHMNRNVSGESTIGRRDYREHLRRGSHARSLSKAWGRRSSPPDDAFQNHTSQTADHKQSQTQHKAPTTHVKPPAAAHDGSCDEIRSRTHIKWDSPEKKAYTNLAFQGGSVMKARRRSSGMRKRIPSGGPFSNPDDQIYEDQRPSTSPVRAPRRSDLPFVTPLTNQDPELAGNVKAISRRFMPSTKIPTMKTSNLPMLRSKLDSSQHQRHQIYLQNEHSEVSGEKQPELEIRSDDIRAATSKRLKDRSPKLPTPAFISGKPGQHIVSFDRDWKPKPQQNSVTVNPRQVVQQNSRPGLPDVTASAPIVPIISVDEGNSLKPGGVNAGGPVVPMINLSSDRPQSRGTDGLLPGGFHSGPTPANRPLPNHSATSPALSSNIHWSPASHRTKAQCSACALPIAGRVVSAASQRFHPECFNCHHCHTALECVAFYPEPENKRSERLARIQSRMEGLDVDEQPGQTADEDGDNSLRFYCHLDFHELFSPRCRSCKTPIESEVVVACGGTWHVGHFFCAECGDPFDPKTPFVEKDGYAWCVKCHAGRFSGKCKGCRKPVIDSGISALGAEWHEGCFVCVVSSSLCRPNP